MTDTLSHDFSSSTSDEDSNEAVDQSINEQIPTVIIESTTNLCLPRKDSIVIPSISNGSISSVLQIEANNNKSLLPVCTSNSLGDLSSTPLLLLDNPVSNSPVSTVISPPEPTRTETTTTFIQCRSFVSSDSSSASTPSEPTAETRITHELLSNEPEDEIEVERILPPKKGPAPAPPQRTVSQSAGEEIFYSSLESPSLLNDQHQSRRSLNRQNHQRHGSADLLCQHPLNHEYMNRSSTTCSAFYPSDSVVSHPLNFYDYDQNLGYIQQIEQELKQSKEQFNATMKSIKTFWSPELKKERNLRKEEACRYQLLINEHQKRTKQDFHIQNLEHQLRQMRDELEKTRQQRLEIASIIPDESNNSIFQRQCQEMKEKLELKINEFHSKENECVTLKAKVDTYESKEKDLQHYISILKESILIKDQQVNMIQSEMSDLRTRLKEKDGIIEKKNNKIQSTRLERQQREFDLQEMKQQLDIRDRKINVLNRKIENLEEQLKDKATQVALTRAKLTALTNNAAAVNVQQQSTVTNNTLLSNLETTIVEKERFIEKLREQKHSAEIEHQEEIEQLQKTLTETRIKLEQKEKDYHEGQNQIIELREQLNNAKSLLQRRETQFQSLEQQMKPTKFENENRILQERLTSIENERREMKQEIDWLQQELEQQKIFSPPNNSSSTTAEINDQQQQLEVLLNKKQQRIEELEQAVRESLQITTEREFAMTQQKRKVENLEKQIKSLQNEVEHFRTENNDQSQILDQLKSELNERKRQYEQRIEEQIKHLDNAFISQQEKLLAELSEKDSQIADLEMDRNHSTAANRTTTINKLNSEKQQLYNQLKELTEIRMKIIQDHLAAKEEYEQREKSLPITSGNFHGNIS